MKRILVLLVAFGLAAAEGVDIGGSVKSNFGVRFSDLGVLEQSAALELNFKYDLADASLFASASLSPAGARLGETGATLYLGDFDLSAGNLLLSSGRTDLFSPLDAFNPRDLSVPLNKPSEQKIPVWALALNYYVADTQISLFASPTFTPSRPPAGLWAVPAHLPPGVIEVETSVPAQTIDNAVVGGRVSSTFAVLDGLDVGATAIYGFTPFPQAKGMTYLSSKDTDANPANGPFRLELGYDRRFLLGADFALAFSIPDVVEGLILRGEGAYAFLPDSAGNNPFAANPWAEGVLELEYTWPADGPHLIALFDTRWEKADAPAPDQLIPRLGAMVNYDYGERLSLSAAWLQNLHDGSGLLRPALSYTFADGVTGELGLHWLYGSAASQFGVWSQNSGLSASLTYSF